MLGASRSGASTADNVGWGNRLTIGAVKPSALMPLDVFLPPWLDILNMDRCGRTVVGPGKQHVRRLQTLRAQNPSRGFNCIRRIDVDESAVTNLDIDNGKA